MTSEREAQFASLVSEVRACTQCIRMTNSVRVIGSASGTIDAPILIIGEAPGRLGADASAIPFHGDRAGDNFEALLEQVGLSRLDCFITNAALCNPKDEKGNNATPTRTELSNCSGFLQRQIDLVNPRIVVTLGSQALKAITAIEDHSVELSSGVRKKWDWYGRVLVPLYHPGQRAMIHRSFHNQLADYQFLAETYRRLDKPQRSSSPKAASQPVAEIAREFLRRRSEISYFSLHKLFYLAEYEHYRRTQQRLTTAYIVRQKDGPYVFELNIKKLKKALSDLVIYNEKSRLVLSMSQRADLFNAKSNLTSEVSSLIDHVVEKYGQSTETELKRAVYMTKPMRTLLGLEKRNRMNTFNRAIDFSLIK